MKNEEEEELCACQVGSDLRCTKRSCRNWIDYPEDNNCVLESVRKNGRMTLAEVGKRLNLSLVRISQIEKLALKKLSKRIKT